MTALAITRKGHRFVVTDDAETRKWRFWEDEFATGRWEAGTLDAIEDILEPGDTYIDIGAWVGPTVLWADLFAARVVAVEPDPAAYRALTVNTQNRPDIRLVNAAVTDKGGTAKLSSYRDWGDSMSTVVPRPDDVGTIEVEAITLADLLIGEHPDRNVGLVKIDIEGGEGPLLASPAAHDLRDLGCPVILGVHWPWLPDRRPVDAFLADYTHTVLDGHASPFPTYLLEPR